MVTFSSINQIKACFFDCFGEAFWDKYLKAVQNEWQGLSSIFPGDRLIEKFLTDDQEDIDQLGIVWLPCVLFNYFEWSNTPEGYEFWSKKCNVWTEYCKSH